MGAWDFGTLDNDGAQDFIGDLLETRGDRWRMIELALELIGHGGVDAEDEEVALAAGEVLAAAASGTAAEELDDELAAWAVSSSPRNLYAMSAKAIAVVEAIMAKSKVRDFWEGRGDLEAWVGALEELKRRLRITIH